MSAAIISIVGMLILISIQSSFRATNLKKTISALQQDARNILLQLNHEFQTAVKPAPVGHSLPPDVEGLQVVDAGSRVIFQVPTNQAFTTFSAPVTIRFVTEDTPVEGTPEFEFGDAMLGQGEDINGDGMLTRQIVRQQSGVTTVVGSANTVAFAAFTMNADNDMLHVQLVLTRRIDPTKPMLARYEIEEEIFIMN